MDFILKNWWYLLLVGGFAFMMFRGGGCCGGGSRARDNQNNGMSGGGGCCGGGSNEDHGRMDNIGGQLYHSDKLSGGTDLVRDPVCGMMIDPATAVKQNLDGQTYYFCSEACRANFVRKHRRPMMGG